MDLGRHGMVVSISRDSTLSQFSTSCFCRSGISNPCAMDFLLAFVSPTLFPALERALEVAFLTGFVQSWKLQATQNGGTARGLPSLRRRRGVVQRHTVIIFT